MSLTLVPGASGSGKSHMLFERVLREAQEHPDRRYIVLVPEQNTLTTQKELTAMSERGGILNIDVLSFTRLAYRVFEQTGVAHRQILSETGKVLLLRLIAAREGKKIPLLGGVLDRPGVLGEMKSILSEMDQYGIDTQKLRELGDTLQQEGSHPALVRKLSELSLLQEAFERYQSDHFITGEKLPRVLCEKAPLDETLKGAEFIVDGFTGFTPAQLQVITTLLGIVEKMTVSVTIDPEEMMYAGRFSLEAVMAAEPSDHDLFALSLRTVRALVQCADEAQVPVGILPVDPSLPGRHKKGSELDWLEGHLLRPGALGRQPYPGASAQPSQPDTSGQQIRSDVSAQPPQPADHQIFFRQCADPCDEAISAAVTISELAKQGVRYREIAIVCGSLKDYAEYLRRVLTQYEIPHYIDRSSTVIMNPAFEFVRCAIGVAEKNFSYESVMALLRTGLAMDPESGEIDKLENYILAAGIRGHKAWADPFVRKTRGQNETLRDSADNIRDSFMLRFEPFEEVMKKSKASFREYAEAVWKLLLSFDVPEKLAKWSEKAQTDGRQERAQEYGAVLKVISDVLDEAAALIGEEQVTRTQFAEILRAGFSEAKIGILPRGIDQVQVGDLERSRLENIRVVLFLGFNDGFVPSRKSAGGVLTDFEREYLRQRKVRLAPTAREEANIQQFYLYRTLTRPSEALYLSWSNALRNGEELRPSFILRCIRDMFPDAAWKPSASEAPFDSVISPETGSSVLAQAMGDCLHSDAETAEKLVPKLKELMNLYRRQERLARQEENTALIQERVLEGLRMVEDGKEPLLDEETALELYGTILRGSITRLEEFSQCAFRHFADYGLRLEEREEFKVQVVDIGNLLHSAMEIFSCKVREEPENASWRTIADDRRDALAREALKEALVRLHGQELYNDTKRSEGILRRCEHIMLRSVKTVQRQVRAGSFEPAYFELAFGGEDSDSVRIDNLPGGRSMQLRGKIDRIDECNDEGAQKLYVRIVDYKSSDHDMDLDSVIEGEQLQLLVYLDEAARLEKQKYPDKEIVCAGVFYFSFQDPLVEVSPEMPEPEREDQVIKKMCMNGLVNSDLDAAIKLDKALDYQGTSIIVPAKRNKPPAGLSVTKSTVSPAQIDLLRSYAKDRMRKIAGAILSGQIAPSPSRKDSKTNACTWCPYKDVCRFDPHTKGSAFREREKRSDQEKWEIIKEAVSGQDGGSGKLPEGSSGKLPEGTDGHSIQSKPENADSEAQT